MRTSCRCLVPQTRPAAPLGLRRLEAIVRWRRGQAGGEESAPASAGGDDEEVLPCGRCGAPLRFIGDKDFHEGTRAWGFVLGDLGELFTGGEKLELWACEMCGHVEFFVPGVG